MTSQSLKKNSTLLMVFATLWFLTTALAEDFRIGVGGLKMMDLQMGTGEVASLGMIATIHFTGWLDEQGVQGKMIYNSRAHGGPISFVIGTDRVMPAWNEGVLGMQAGGQRLLLVPPGMAYGNRAIDDDIPANASLRLNIELLRLEQPVK